MHSDGLMASISDTMYD